MNEKDIILIKNEIKQLNDYCDRIIKTGHNDSRFIEVSNAVLSLYNNSRRL